jgi:hypothetical protein
MNHIFARATNDNRDPPLSAPAPASPPLSFPAQGTFGPFLPGTPATAPLWLAVALKENQQARILCPPWLEKGALESTLKEERNHPERFSRIPYYYVEIAELLMRYARDDLPSADAVEGVLREVQAQREAKVQGGMRIILTEAQGQEIVESVEVNNMAATEANLSREGVMKVRRDGGKGE